MTWWSRTSAALGLGCLALLTTSCGGYGSVCQAEMDCRGGNSNDVAACEDEFEREEGVAGAAHCDKEFSDFYACYQDHASCQGNLKFDARGFCDGQEKILHDCTASVRGYQLF